MQGASIYHLNTASCPLVQRTGFEWAKISRKIHSTCQRLTLACSMSVVTIFLFFAHRQPVRSVQWKTWRLKLWASLSLEFKVLLQCNNCPAGFIKVGLEILWFVCLSHCTFESKPNRLGIVFFSPTAATLSYITQALTRREEQSICLAQ